MNSNPIGVFDSGVGGLSCVPAIKKKMPNESIVYFGDTLRAPYGNREPKEIVQFSLEIADKLVNEHQCKALAIACNTISCIAIDDLKKAYPSIPIVGIVEPAKEYVLKNYANKKCGVIATQATINNGAYSILGPGRAAQEFVAAIENDTIDEAMVKRNLEGFAEGLEVLVLGCTHFPFAKKLIENCYKNLFVFDPAEALAEAFYQELKKNGLFSEKKEEADLFLVSKDTPVFNRILTTI